MDQMVLETQQWLNKTYTGMNGYEKIPEDGQTGWTTIYALTRALQIELGIAQPSDNFGPETESLFQPLQKGVDQGLPNNQVYILQGAFWCKGIGPGSFTGLFDDDTQTTVQNFQSDAGLTNLDGIVTTQIMKALLDMSAFVLVPGGDSRIRDMQQRLNRDYNAYFGLQPCDGLYGRNTNQALIYALQCEEGMSTSVANGYFGPGTTQDCPTLSLNDSRTNFVYILQYALYCNGYDPGDFNGQYTDTVKTAVSNFQKFIVLPITGVANMSTIKALLSSAGDTNRDALACDCSTVLDANTVQAIKSAGFEYIGRYLTGTVGTGSNQKSKAMTQDELTAIFNTGLKIFPIYEDGGYQLDYFTTDQGIQDAEIAIHAAQDLGIPSSATIYFAVDFDALDEDITSNILPYFDNVSSVFNDFQTYKVGIYGARNICTRVSEAGYAENSFVADMSTGFSGNLGFKMPGNWTFDQFNTITVGNSSLGYVEVDMNAYSGTSGISGIDEGVDHVNPVPSSAEINMARFNKLSELKPIVPALNDFSTVNFDFDKDYSVRTGPIKITLSATDRLSTPGSDYQSFTVSKGNLTTNFSAALGQLNLTVSQIASYQDLMSKLAVTVGYGNILVKITSSANEFSLSFILIYEKIPVSNFDGFTTTLSATLTYTIDYVDPGSSSDPAIPETSRIPDFTPLQIGLGITAVLVVGVIIVEAAAIVALAAAIVESAAATVSTCVAAFS